MKNSRGYAIVLCSMLIFTAACSNDTDDYIAIVSDTDLENEILKVSPSLDELMLPENDLSKIPSDPKNPITEQKVALGKMLFHETGLAKAPKQEEGMNTYSCASCHQSKAGFQSGMKQGIGEGGFGFGLIGEARSIAPFYDIEKVDVQPIRSPTILNTAYQDVMLWNGQFGATKTNQGTEAQWTAETPKETNALGFEGVETQAIAGSDVHRLFFDPEMLRGNVIYKTLFDEAFPEIPETERYSKLNGALAIAAYERTVVASEAPFQKWLQGDGQALTENEKQGAILFFGKGKCYNCHSGPGLNGMDFHALGMNDLSGQEIIGNITEGDKKGRGGFTQNPEDNYKFKTPTLYNLRDLKFLGHGGSFGSVKAIIEYKNTAQAENKEVPQSNLSDQFQPLGLTLTEIAQLTVFIENGLFDANLERYVPESLPTGHCFPVADTKAREDLGCD